MLLLLLLLLYLQLGLHMNELGLGLSRRLGLRVLPWSTAAWTWTPSDGVQGRVDGSSRPVCVKSAIDLDLGLCSPETLKVLAAD